MKSSPRAPCALALRAVASLLLSNVFLTPVASAQNFERVLIPVASSGTPGAYGSFWVTELTGYNRGAAFTPVVLSPGDVCGIPEGCGDPPARPRVPFVLDVGTFPMGRFIYVASEGADEVIFKLRVRDAAHPENGFGTEVPVARESDFTSETMVLLNVPLVEDARTTLRVYGLDDREELVRVRVLPLIGTIPVAEFDLLLRGSAVVPDLASLAGTSIPELRYRVEITPGDPGARVWAFGSVTSNGTQQVTILTIDR